MRKCRSLVLLALALVLTAPAPASAQVTLPGCQRPATLVVPFAFVAVNGQCTDLSASITRIVGGKGWGLVAHLELSTSIIDLRAIFNPDPSVTYSGTTTNLTGATNSYAFIFGTPIVPDFYSSAISTLKLSLTTPTGTTTVDNSSTYPTYVSGYGTLGSELTLLGVDLGTAPCVASGTAAQATCDEGTASSSFPSSFFDNLEAVITYTQDNAGSVVKFDGEVAINRADVVTTTPEPATFMLVGAGLAAMLVQRRRRRLG